MQIDVVSGADVREQEDQVFIISWRGQHERACAIARALEGGDFGVSVVFSDPDPDLRLETRAGCLRRDDSLFFGDKFKACTEAFSGERILVINADCFCDDWKGLAARCFFALRQNPDIWVWAPHIDYSGFGLDRTRVMTIPGSQLVAVAHTDTIVFGMARSVVERLRTASLDRNTFGWGVGWMAVAYSCAHGGWVVVDDQVKVLHPRTRGYDSREAARQRNEFLAQLTPREAFFCCLLESHMLLQDSRTMKMKDRA